VLDDEVVGVLGLHLEDVERYVARVDAVGGQCPTVVLRELQKLLVGAGD
jgi:hypothetical protein